MKLFTILFLALVFSFSTARADTVTITDAGWGGTGWTQAGAYTVQTTNGQSYLVVCKDDRFSSTIGLSYQANITFDWNDLSATRGNEDQRRLYNRGSWLAGQLFEPANEAQHSNIQTALWTLFNPNRPTSLASNAWLNASNNFSDAPTSGFAIVTPNDKSLNQQEFFAKLGSTEIPEPATLILLGTGLATLASRLKKKKPKQQVFTVGT